MIDTLANRIHNTGLTRLTPQLKAKIADTLPLAAIDRLDDTEFYELCWKMVGKLNDPKKVYH